MSRARYAVGIDLGTTHCAMAAVSLESGDDAPVEQVPLPQLVSAGAVEAREVLPSFLYLPGSHELPAGALSLPWDAEARDAVGLFARAQGARLPGRLVSSAKSWLCHPGVDRRAGLLPWQAEADVVRLSPVAASARYLAHLRAAWDHAHPGDPLNAQDVLIAVPASFDAVARELTIEAAQQAGLSQPRLIEEPQAAFYAWIAASQGRWREAVSVGERVLVVDVGGGTTDFSLIEVQQAEGELVLERLAVGDHLLVGGDNMDLALARALEAQLAEAGTRLDGWQLQALWHGCREAKEAMLASGELSRGLSIPGRGSKLVGGAIGVALERALLDRILVDGFFPGCAAETRPARRRVGLAELGLPYEHDPAVTHHLAAFLGRHVPDRPVPEAVLFNGGVFKAAALRERALEVLGGWGAAAPRALAGAQLDLAVSRGAAYYGLARHGRGVRIRGGTARAYYIGVESAMPAVPGLPTPIKAVCVAPFGMEEGTHAAISGHTFGLLTGEPASFRFFGSTTRREDAPGQVLPHVQELDELDPVEVTLEGKPGQVVPVALESVLTELGTLELWSVEQGGAGRWKLAYELRERDSAGG